MRDLSLRRKMSYVRNIARVRERVSQALAKALIQTLVLKKGNESYFPTTGNWTGCCKSLQKRAKHREKNILFE